MRRRWANSVRKDLPRRRAGLGRAGQQRKDAQRGE